MNLQPLPRSSYKREYLYMKSQPDEKIVNRDHFPFAPNSKMPLSSSYEKDYTSLKAESMDYK
jgi:hypothetical protein